MLGDMIDITIIPSFLSTFISWLILSFMTRASYAVKLKEEEFI